MRMYTFYNPIWGIPGLYVSIVVRVTQWDVVKCVVPENIHTPHGWSMEIPRGWGG